MYRPVNIVNRPVVYVQTIDDLLDDRLHVYTDQNKLNGWTNPSFYQTFGNNSFKAQFIKLGQKLKQWNTREVWRELYYAQQNPDKFSEAFNDIAIIEDEMLMSILIPYFPRFVSIHVGQPYLPVLITPLCYGPNFPFVLQTELL